MTDRTRLLEPSPYEIDGGSLIGRDPRKLTREDFAEAGVELRRMNKAIRAKCLDCVAGSESEVRKCVSISCPLWPIRMGVLPRALRPARTDGRTFGPHSVANASGDDADEDDE